MFVFYIIESLIIILLYLYITLVSFSSTLYTNYTSITSVRDLNLVNFSDFFKYTDIFKAKEETINKNNIWMTDHNSIYLDHGQNNNYGKVFTGFKTLLNESDRSIFIYDDLLFIQPYAAKDPENYTKYINQYSNILYFGGNFQYKPPNVNLPIIVMQDDSSKCQLRAKLTSKYSLQKKHTSKDFYYLDLIGGERYISLNTFKQMK